MAILCDFKGRSEKEVIHHIISRLKQYHQENEKGFRESMSMLEVLSSNRNLNKQVREEEKMLSARWDELPSYEIGYEKGIEKGIENIAMKLLKINSLNEVSEITGLSKKQLIELKKQEESS